jgi:thiamine-monophosphate kinase
VPLPERRLIERIRAASNVRAPALVRGIGDDCAVLRPPAGHELLVTTDFSLEGIHFRRDWHAPEVVGHRCLTRGLSDIAAMGGDPLAVFLSLALPVDLPQRWADGFLKGLLKLAKQFRVPLAGGDTAQSPAGVLADIVVVGSAPRGKAILRSGAKAGNRIYVTGSLGGSAATLSLLEQGRKLSERVYPQHFAPTPRLEIGRVLREKKLASAMIDLSDGLSVDLTHLCEDSGTRAVIDSAAIPLAKIGKAKKVSLEHALHGGEDYELLFTAPFNKRIPRLIAGVPVTMIGAVVDAAPGQRCVVLMTDGVGTELLPQGWEHFRKQ